MSTHARRERQRLQRLAALFEAAAEGQIPLPYCFDCPKCGAIPGGECNPNTRGKYRFHKARVDVAVGYDGQDVTKDAG